MVLPAGVGESLGDLTAGARLVLKHPHLVRTQQRQPALTQPAHLRVHLGVKQ